MSVIPLLHCQDLQQTRHFYMDLGFEAELSEQTLTLRGHGARLLFTEQNLWQRSTGCSGTFYFSVDDSYFAKLAERADLLWPLQDMPYGSREFGLLDCNGYCLAFQRQR